MTKEAMEIFENNGAEHYGEYSGRNMFGNITQAVTFETKQDFRNSLVDIVKQAVQENKDTEQFKNLRLDSFGLGIIVY